MSKMVAILTPNEIKGARAELGYKNQSEFADALGITRESVSNAENGKAGDLIVYTISKFVTDQKEKEQNV